MKLRAYLFNWLLVAVLTGAIACGLYVFFGSSHAASGTQRGPALNLAEVLGGAHDSGFAHAVPGRRFGFPADYGPHPRYRSEWWYFTGNLKNAAGREFGYEFTLFRFALSAKPKARASDWAANQIYMAHLAVTDVTGKRFHFAQRLERGAAGLAGVHAVPFTAWLDNWSVRGTGHGFPWRLRAATKKMGLDLTLDPRRPVVLEGDAGFSRKSAAAGNASYYYSIPRLTIRGRLRLGATTYAVDGVSWLDREWGSGSLAADQSGWDWFALHLSDGYDLMFYRLRDKNGRTDAYSAGSLINPVGKIHRLGAGDITLTVQKHWRSPRGGVYPSQWRLSIPTDGVRLTIKPLVANQELAVSIRYWEGAVRFSGVHGGHSVSGDGYVELTGYASK